MAFLILKVCAVFYLVALVIGLSQLFRPREGRDRWVLIGLSLSVAAHAVALAVRAAQVRGLPVANLHDGLSVFAFLAGLCILWVSWRFRVPQAAALGLVLLAALVVGAVSIEPVDAVPVRLRSHWLPMHIAFALLGDAAFVGAGVVSVIYLIQDGRLRHKRRLAKSGTGLHRLPPLEMLDRASVRLINIGFPLMTLGVLTGGIYGYTLGSTFWVWDPRNIVTLLVWMLYGVLIHVRLTIGWRGRRLAWLTLAGVVTTLLAFVVFGLLGVGHHAVREPLP